MKRLDNAVRLPSSHGSDECPETISDGTRKQKQGNRLLIGVLQGEGIGPEVVPAAMRVLRAVLQKQGVLCEFREGGLIGNEAIEKHGRPLTDEVIDFCDDVFRHGGTVMCGPGGDRFVYDLRARFNLFCKLTPIVPLPGLDDTGVIRPAARRDVDIIVVRENLEGVYSGTASRLPTKTGERVSHIFHYDSASVRRILGVAIRLAARRRQRLALVVKRSGVPAVSRLWTDLLQEMACGTGLATEVLEVDNMAYQILAAAGRFDVVVAPNLFGDILSDIAALLLGSRGMSFSGNMSPDGAMVFQTGHGAAYDLAGRDRANPVGQILSTAMMLRHACGLETAAGIIESAVAAVLRSGIRTADIAGPDSQVVGTQQMTSAIVTAVEQAKLDDAGAARFDGPQTHVHAEFSLMRAR